MTACALLSKTAVCEFPVALLVVLWWKRGRLGWRDVGLVVPLLALAAGLGWLTVWVEKTRFAEAHCNAGRALMQIGQCDEAATHLTKSAELDPGNTEAQQQLEALLARRNRIADDMRLYQSLLERNPDNASAHVQMGRLLEEQGKRREAMEHYRKALSAA